MRSFGQYCTPTTSSSSDRLSKVETIGAIADVLYQAPFFEGGFVDRTDLVIMATPNQTFNLNTTYVGGVNGVGIWIDWNNNEDFTDTGESYGGLNNNSADKSFQITIPSATPYGSYRMRVRGQWGSSANPGPCDNINYGSAVDFTIVVLDPSCLPPTGLDVVINNPESVDLSWNASTTSPDGYEYEVSSSR